MVLQYAYTLDLQLTRVYAHSTADMLRYHGKLIRQTSIPFSEYPSLDTDYFECGSAIAMPLSFIHVILRCFFIVHARQAMRLAGRVPIYLGLTE